MVGHRRSVDEARIEAPIHLGDAPGRSRTGALAEMQGLAASCVRVTCARKYFSPPLATTASVSTDPASGVAGLSIRVARSINRELSRSGGVLADRYNARPLTTPREMRNCLVYVLMNFKKHRQHVEVAGRDFDMLSSAPWFDGWDRVSGQRDPPSTIASHASQEPLHGEPAVKAPRTWLAQYGWRRYGLIRLTESPSRS